VSQFALHEVQRRLEKHPDFTTNIEKAFKETFLAVDEALKHEALIEPLYAGTTACVALLRENELVVSNVGDSRAVLARRHRTKINEEDDSVDNDVDVHTSSTTQQEEWETIDLSKDQNPDLPEEQSRIESMGGFVSPPPEPGLSARVWLDPGCTQIGLAMSRSMGDHAVKPVGVIAEPVVSTHHVTIDDEFLILASDGVWEFVASHEAVRVVSDNLHLGATQACQALIEMAAARWHDEEGDYRDDITALVIRLQHLWSNNSKTEEESSPNKKKSRTETATDAAASSSSTSLSLHGGAKDDNDDVVQAS
jgi:protein phosphatase PTC2/3